jgi:MEMO1 family protein
MLVFAGFTPSSPLLLPTINQAKIHEVQTTRTAIEHLAEELYASHPDTLVVLAENATMYSNAFSIDVADPYIAELSDFGDLGYRKHYHPDFSFIDKLQRYLRQTELPISLSTDNRLSAAVTVPLELLTQHLPHIRIVPVAPCELDPKLHFNLGTAFKHLILESDKRIAVVAAGDMANTLSKTAPAGYHKDGKLFDERVLTTLQERSVTGLLQIPDTLAKNAHNTAYRQLCMLMGVLDGMQVTPHILSYASPFGVGYGVAHFEL